MLNHQTVFASVVWSSCLAMLAAGANSTAIMAALPDMRTELSLSSAGVEWAVNAYLVVSAACIVLGGRAADRFGSRLASMVGRGRRAWTASEGLSPSPLELDRHHETGRLLEW
jgi:MFS family permease